MAGKFVCDGDGVKGEPCLLKQKKTPSCILLLRLASCFNAYLAPRKQRQLIWADPVLYAAEALLLADADGVPVGRA